MHKNRSYFDVSTSRSSTLNHGFFYFCFHFCYFQVKNSLLHIIKYMLQVRTNLSDLKNWIKSKLVVSIQCMFALTTCYKNGWWVIPISLWVIPISLWVMTTTSQKIDPLLCEARSELPNIDKCVVVCDVPSFAFSRSRVSGSQTGVRILKSCTGKHNRHRNTSCMLHLPLMSMVQKIQNLDFQKNLFFKLSLPFIIITLLVEAWLKKCPLPRPHVGLPNAYTASHMLAPWVTSVQ